MSDLVPPATRRTMLGIGAATMLGHRAQSQPAPAFRPGRILVAAPPGGSPDVVARLLAAGLSARRGHAIAVENRPGADGAIAAEAFVQARPGDALFFMFGDMATTAAMLPGRPPFDPLRDFVPISTAADDRFIIATTPDLPVRSLGDLVAFARQRPGGLNWFASPGPPWLAFRAFMRTAGIDMTYVAYRGAPPALLDLAGGRIQVTLTPLAPAAALAREDRIRPIAAPGRERVPGFPEVPTTGEAGSPDFLIQGLLGLVGWRDMPDRVRDELSMEVRQILAEPSVTERLATAGLTARGSTPTQYAAELVAFAEQWRHLVQEFGARPPG